VKLVSPLLAALSFLSRLGPARLYDDATLAATVKYFPLAGAVIGALATAPFFFGFLRGHPWLQAWLLLVLSLWLTRALHWDGWADLFDAWGSGARGERFWEIMKDSRLGTFGAVALFVGLAGQLFLLRNALEAGAYGAVAWAFVLGRATCAATAYMGRNLARGHGLGRTFLAGATPWALLLVVTQTLVLGLAVRPDVALAPALAVACLGVVELAALARRMGGMNGDFLGAAVIWGELAGLMGYTAVSGLPLLP
jgi:adenosylcobinamide-GDP ribazoletransferase